MKDFKKTKQSKLNLKFSAYTKIYQDNGACMYVVVDLWYILQRQNFPKILHEYRKCKEVMSLEVQISS